MTTGHRFNTIDPRRTAFIAIDLQIALMSSDVLKIVPAVNRMAGALRDAGGTVVFVRYSFLAEGPGASPAWQFAEWGETVKKMHPSAPEHAVHPALDVRPGDLVIDKYRQSAFLPTSSTLDRDLRARDIDTVIITGTVTNICCESSARDAQMMGYNVIFVSDATCAGSAEDHDGTLRNMSRFFADVRTADEVVGLIAHGRAAA